MDKSLLKKRWIKLLNAAPAPQNDWYSRLINGDGELVSDVEYTEILGFVQLSKANEQELLLEKLIGNHGFRPMLLRYPIPAKAILKNALLHKKKLNAEEVTMLKLLFEKWQNRLFSAQNEFKKKHSTATKTPDIEDTIFNQLKNYDFAQKKLIVNEISYKAHHDKAPLHLVAIDSSASMQRAAIEAVFAILLNKPNSRIKREICLFNDRVTALAIDAPDLAKQLLAISYEGTTDIKKAVDYAVQKFAAAKGVFWLVSDLMDSNDNQFEAALLDLSRKGVKIAVIVPAEENVPYNQRVADNLLKNKIEVLPVSAMEKLMYSR